MPHQKSFVSILLFFFLVYPRYNQRYGVGWRGKISTRGQVTPLGVITSSAARPPLTGEGHLRLRSRDDQRPPVLTSIASSPGIRRLSAPIVFFHRFAKGSAHCAVFYCAVLYILQMVGCVFTAITHTSKTVDEFRVAENADLDGNLPPPSIN